VLIEREAIDLPVNVMQWIVVAVSAAVAVTTTCCVHPYVTAIGSLARSALSLLALLPASSSSLLPPQLTSDHAVCSARSITHPVMPAFARLPSRLSESCLAYGPGISNWPSTAMSNRALRPRGVGLRWKMFSVTTLLYLTFYLPFSLCGL